MTWPTTTTYKVGTVLTRSRAFATQVASAFNGMHHRVYIPADNYWAIYNTNKDKLVVFQTVSAPAGGWHSPFKAEMMVEWGYPGKDEPLIGYHETWDVDASSGEIPMKRHNVQKQYWACVPYHDTDF